MGPGRACRLSVHFGVSDLPNDSMTKKPLAASLKFQSSVSSTANENNQVSLTVLS